MVQTCVVQESTLFWTYETLTSVSGKKRGGGGGVGEGKKLEGQMVHITEVDLSFSKHLNHCIKKFPKEKRSNCPFPIHEWKLPGEKHTIMLTGFMLTP